MKPFLVAALLAVASLLSYNLAGAEEARPAENLSRLIDSAIADNPELKASEARWQMFRNRVVHEGRLEDPMLMLKIQNGIVTDPLNFSKDAMTQKVVGLSQQLPYFGKRALRREVAEREGIPPPEPSVGAITPLPRPATPQEAASGAKTVASIDVVEAVSTASSEAAPTRRPIHASTTGKRASSVPSARISATAAPSRPVEPR